jgi:hypothetical protein
MSNNDLIRINRNESDINYLNRLEIPDTSSLFTGCFNWTPTFTGFSVAPTGGLYRYVLIGGKLCWVFVRMPDSGTSNSTVFQMTAPFASANVNVDMVWGNALLSCVDNGAIVPNSGNAYIGNNTNLITIQKSTDGAPWTASGGKRANFQLVFEIQI